jgi:hypothetical protein
VRAFFEVGATPPAAPATPPAGASTDAERIELGILRDQLGRMRGMLYKFTHEFFRTIHLWAIVSLALLVAGTVEGWRAAAILVPFVVPFAFLETAYLFYYTVYARRHAERLEQAINERLGHDVLAAHRTEAAYFYPPDRPKVAFLSFGNPLGMGSAMTVGYTVGAALLWAAGLVLTIDVVADAGSAGLLGLVVPAQLVWTGAIAAWLVGYSLLRRDEDRLLEVLATSYRVRPPAPERTATRPADPAPGPADDSAPRPPSTPPAADRASVADQGGA